MPTLTDHENVIPFPGVHASETTHDAEPLDTAGILMPLPVGKVKLSATSTESMDMKRTLKEISECLLDNCDPAFIQVVSVERYTRSRATDAYTLTCQVRLGNGRIYSFTAEKKPCRFRAWTRGVQKHTVPMERFSLVRERSMLDNWLPMMGIARGMEEISPTSLHMTLMDLSSMTDEGPVRHILMEGTWDNRFAHVREEAGENGSVSRTASRTRHLFHLLSKAVDRYMTSLN